MIALTKALGKELATYDIAVNCITPAAARTRIFDQITKEFVDFMLTKIPRGRFVTVEEVAAMVAWLASAENSFTTGAVFDLSGGRATYLTRRKLPTKSAPPRFLDGMLGDAWITAHPSQR